jgi:hypothetical protein
MSMFGRNQVADKDLLKTINQKISRTGTSSRITAVVRQGTVTLTGNIPYEAQRTPIVKSVSRIPGVRSVIDQLKFVTKKFQFATQVSPPIVVQPEVLTDTDVVADIPVGNGTPDAY